MSKIINKYIIQEGKEYRINDLNNPNKIIQPDNLKFKINIFEKKSYQRYNFYDEYSDLILEQLPKGTIWKTKIEKEFNYNNEKFTFEANLELEFPNIFRFYKIKPCRDFMFEIVILEYIDSND